MKLFNRVKALTLHIYIYTIQCPFTSPPKMIQLTPELDFAGLSRHDQTVLKNRLMQLASYQQEKDHYLRLFVRLDPQDPNYIRNIRDLKRSIRQAELFICSYRVLVKEISQKAVVADYYYDDHDNDNNCA